MITDIDFPAYGDDGRAARDIFFADCVDVMFYFEDAGQEHVYDLFLSKIGIKLNYAVICPGGKSKFKKILTEKSEAQRVFVCDKDFDDITGEAKDYMGPEFVYLGRFCFENYLITELGLSRIIVESSCKTIRQITPLLDLRGFLDRLVVQYEKLSKIYAVARKNRILIPTTKTSVSELINGVCTKDEPIPTDDYVESVRVNLLNWCEAHGHWLTDRDQLLLQEESAFEILDDFSDVSDRSQLSNLCGKHLLRLIFLYIDRSVGTTIVDEDSSLIYSRLISHTDNSNFESIRQRILSAFDA